MRAGELMVTCAPGRTPPCCVSHGADQRACEPLWQSGSRYEQTCDKEKKERTSALAHGPPLMCDRSSGDSFHVRANRRQSGPRSCPARRSALCWLRTEMNRIDDASWPGLLRRGATKHFRIVALAVATTLASRSTALAQPQGGEGKQEPTWVFSSGASLTLFPSGDVYPVYVADPHRPTNVVAEAFTIDGGMPATDSPLTRLGAGGRFGVMRIEPARPDGRVWQVSIEAGFDAIFDSQNRLDAVGWDGNYGLTVTTASSSPIALKIAVLHISAHVGDEYQERTGRPRINYTREELSVGAAWRWSPRWRTYGETGVAYKSRSSVARAVARAGGSRGRVGARSLRSALRLLRRGRRLRHAGAGLAGRCDNRFRDRHPGCGQGVSDLSRVAPGPPNSERVFHGLDVEPQPGPEDRPVAGRPRLRSRKGSTIGSTAIGRNA